MRANAVFLIVIALLFLVGTVAAIIPDTVTITSDKSYLIANGVEQSVINVVVKNTSSGLVPIPGATVTFSVDPVYGTLSPTSGTTNASGTVSSIFKVKTKSGFADIQVDVSYSDGINSFSKISILRQNIDHNKDYYATFSHPFEGEVNTTVPFNISFTDYYGNPIDRLINSNQSHTINLHVYGPPPDDCNFVGYGHDILNKELDQYSNISTQIKLTSGAGPNSITMDQFELIPPPSQRIITAVSSDVSSMQSSINPTSPPGVPADGTSKFSIVYILYDKFRNPAGQKELWVNTSIGGNTKFKTDSLGRIAITYGPRTAPGIITINATSVNNPLVNSSYPVEFTSTAATTLVLMANPEVMVSRDKNPLIQSIITAQITDIMGGPSPNETVTFSLGADEYPGYNETIFSSFSQTGLRQTTINETSDGNGEAKVNFYPGSFTTNPNALNYSSTATGQVLITATWTNPSLTTVTKNILVKWKNYPYLSAKTSVIPDSVNINETVNVTILLDADGWALQPNPTDVILVIDRSGSMGWNTATGYDSHSPNPIRLDSAKSAAKTFVSQMNQSRDRIGVVSFAGYTHGTETRTDISLSNTYSNVNHVIDNHLSADGATETREALKQSIGILKAATPNPNAIQAIILMTDGDYNWKGNPLGRGRARDSSYSFSTNTLEPNNFLYYSGLAGSCSLGADCQSTEQNMSVYAKNNNIRLYTIGFASVLDPQAVSDMQIMANATGGFYDYAPDATALTQIYTKIAGELKDTDGVNTTMNADFEKVNVTGVDYNGSEVFDYVYNQYSSTKIKWQDGNSNVTDQSSDWDADNKLNFTIGTMKVGQTWEATFQLKVKKSGSIDVFGPNSFLLFNGTDPLALPRTFLTVKPNLTTGFEQEQIDVVGDCSLLDQNKAIVPINWWTTYTGGNTTIFEEVNYIDDTGAHINFYKGSYPVTTSNFTQRSTIFDLKTVPQNRYYNIEVRTYTSNVRDTTIACGGAIYNSTGKTFIKLN